MKALQLADGYSGHLASDQYTDHGTLTLAPNKPCRPNLGAPLSPSVTVKRMGRLLKLDYQLRDDAGWTYQNNERTKPPTFAIYQGDREIGSGTFEYG